MLSHAQNRIGTFRPDGAAPIPWAISAQHCLVWNGSPYQAVGLRIPGTRDAIVRAAEQGITDVIVELPHNGAGWDAAIEALAAQNMRYLIAIDSLALAAEAFVVEPQSYRINSVTPGQTVRVSVPSSLSALVVLASKRDASIAHSQRIASNKSQISYTPSATSGDNNVILLYPELTAAPLVDCWEGFDDRRDSLLRSLKNAKFGAGFRGLLNPLGASLARSNEITSVPKSPRFRAEFAAFLERRYRNIDTAMKSWSMSVSEVDSFAILSRLVPLWSGNRGVSELWDPATDKTYLCDSKRSQFWTDLRSVIAGEEVRRYQRLCASIKKVVDVPVLQDWVGWHHWYEGASDGLDGISAKLPSTNYLDAMDYAGRAASSLYRQPQSAWLIAGQIDVDGTDPNFKMDAFVDDLRSMGVHSFYFQTDVEAVRAAIKPLNEKIQADSGSATWSPIPIFYPEAANFPAATQRLPAGRWWLPSPLAGNRIDLGSQFFAYRTDSNGQATFVLWSKTPSPKTKVRFGTPKTVQVHGLDGMPIPIKVLKDGVELDLGEFPVFFSNTAEIPVPQPAYNEAMARFELLVKRASKSLAEITEPAFAVRDAVRGFDRNPGGSMVRIMDSIEKINRQLAPYMWVEAEAYRNSTFSDMQLISGCSDGAAMTLRASLLGLNENYQIQYTFPNRTPEEVEVWMAARIAPAYMADVSLYFGSQQLKIMEGPISRYGQGYGWYRMGVTRNSGNQATMEIRVIPSLGADISIDAFMLSPTPFRPNGPIQPYIETPLPPKP